MRAWRPVISLLAVGLTMSACASAHSDGSTPSATPSTLTFYDADIPFMEADVAKQVDQRLRVHGTVVVCPVRSVRWHVGQRIECPITVPGYPRGYALITLMNAHGAWTWAISNTGAWSR